MSDSEAPEPVVIHLSAEDFDTSLFKALMAERELYTAEAEALYQEWIRGIEWDNSESDQDQQFQLYQDAYSFVRRLHRAADNWSKGELS
jgi:hypothetical protein